MIKHCLGISLLLASSCVFAYSEIELYKAPMSKLKQYPLLQASKNTLLLKGSAAATSNSLQQINQTKEGNLLITRYQQMYRGIPVIGAQIMIAKQGSNGIANDANSEVNGYLLDEIHINTNPEISKTDATALAKKYYFKDNSAINIQEESVELQIRPGEQNELKLVYLVSFKGVEQNQKPIWPFIIVDAQTGAVIQAWNNVKTYSDTGPGGNEKVHEYWYGRDGLPALDVTRQGDVCIMDNSKVRLVNLSSKWDWDNKILTAHEYACNKNIEENINGAYSPSNDAYYFGQVIVDMYKDWYGLNALQEANGMPMKLLMRVHFGEGFDNAFWDGKSMSFGDGEDFYPLVSLDVAGHEVTHGFTEQHSGLEYHDQSGAINESMSDMAGQTSRAYLLEKSPQLYSKAYMQSNEVTWGIGETIIRDSFGKALRFMDYPSSDGSSADCLDKSLAQSNGAYCAISYDEVLAYAKANVPSFQQQGYIVHTASGVFNKAFYLMSKKLGIKTAYQVMIIANTKYWTPNSDFKDGACGVIHAANDMKLDPYVIRSSFNQVGVDTGGCAS
jgi:vibriolysin